MTCLALGVVAISTSEARSDPDPLFPREALACRKESDAPRAAPADEGDSFTAISRHAPPRDVTRVDLVVDDVAIAEPIPRSKVDPAIDVAPPIETIASENDFRCTGPVRGRAGMLRVLDSPPGSRWPDGSTDRAEKRAFARGAGIFDVREAAPLLRRELSRPVPETASYDGFDILQSDLTAIRGLADLDDRAAAPLVREFLAHHEASYMFYPWKDALESLARLDPAVAESYAIEVAGRAADDPKHFGDASQSVLAVLPFFTTPSDEARAALKKLAGSLASDTSDIGWYFECNVLATSMRMGDPDLRSEFAPILAGKANDTQREVMCYSQIIGAAFPGDDPSEVETLVLRHRFVEILRLVARMRDADAAHAPLAGSDAARTKIRAFLTKTLQADGTFADDRVYALTTLAVMGDHDALEKLYATVDDPADDHADAWYAARFALEQHLPGAADHAAVRLTWGVSHYLDDSWSGAGFRQGEHVDDVVLDRDGVRFDERAALVEAMANAHDPRFALGLLQDDERTHPLAAFFLARQRPAAACGIVTEASKKADRLHLTDAFWSLSVLFADSDGKPSELGAACKKDFEALARDKTAPERARELAIDDLAMLRETEAENLVESPIVPWSRFAKPRDTVEILLHATE